MRILFESNCFVPQVMIEGDTVDMLLMVAIIELDIKYVDGDIFKTG